MFLLCFGGPITEQEGLKYPTTYYYKSNNHGHLHMCCTRSSSLISLLEPHGTGKGLHMRQKSPPTRVSLCKNNIPLIRDDTGFVCRQCMYTALADIREIYVRFSSYLYWSVFHVNLAASLVPESMILESSFQPSPRTNVWFNRRLKKH